MFEFMTTKQWKELNLGEAYVGIKALSDTKSLAIEL